MKYPISHSHRIAEIEPIVKSWPVEKSFDQVVKWLMQFDTDDIELGIRIITHLNVIGFEDLNTSLSIAYSKLERVAIEKGSRISSRNTLFAGIGDGAKSGAMIGYNFRIVNELSEENFMTEESINHLESGLIENVVLIDDIIGTGQQAASEIKSITEKVTPFGVKNVFLLTAVGMSRGIKAIIDDTKAHVFSAFEYCDLDTASNLDSPFYSGVPHESRGKLRQRLEYYGGVASKSPLGFGGIGALIAFYYNTPNISLPVIWSSANSWIPLFRRAVKINGINSYYKQIEASIAKKKRDNKPIEGKDNELLLVVEGRFDEVFYEYIVDSIKDQIPFDKTTTIALGGYTSKKLVENISRLSRNCLFLVELEERHGGHAKWIQEQVEGNVGGGRWLEVPATETLFDIERLRKDERWARFFEMVDNPSHSRSTMFEIKRRVLGQSALQRDVLERFLDEEKVAELKRSLLQSIQSMSSSSHEVKAK